MALPKYTISGRKAWKDWIENQLKEIEGEIRANPVELSGENWVPMYRELMEYTFTLEERIDKMVEAMQILSQWIDAQQGMNDDETRIFDSLNERVLALEVQSSSGGVKK